MNSWEQPSVFHKDNFRIVVVVERKSRKGGRGEKKRRQRRKKYIYIYIFTVISRIHRPSPRSWSVNRRPILRPILVHRGGLANSIGERKRRCETCARLAYEFPLKRFRYRFRGSTSMSRSLLPLPPRLSREKENCGWNLLKGKRKKKSWGAWCSVVYTWSWRGLCGMITRGWLWFEGLRIEFDCRVFEEERGAIR